MSEECRMIRVHAPHMAINREVLTVRGLRCGYCQGNGWFWGMDDMGQSVKRPCPMCHGSKEVDAKVTIEYRAPTVLPPTEPQDDNDYKPFKD